MRAGRTSRTSHRGDYLPLTDPLIQTYLKSMEVTVPCYPTVTVTDLYNVSVAPDPTAVDNYPPVRGSNGSPGRRSNIDPAVHSNIAVYRVNAILLAGGPTPGSGNDQLPGASSLAASGAAFPVHARS